MKEIDKQKMLKIGDVARLNDVSVHTLRYYDKIGLYKADWVDENGYRYYWPSNMVTLDLILWLRMDGLGIEQIREILNDQSLEHTKLMIKRREREIVDQMKRLQQQLQLYRMYSGYMHLAEDYADREPYFLSFSDRWCIQTQEPLARMDRNTLELGMKELFGRMENKFYYYNSFFGGVFHRLDQYSYESGMHPAIFHFVDLEQCDNQIMKEGIYAILPVHGFFNNAFQKIPTLLRFVRQHHYHVCSDFYVIKIWERSGQHDEAIEIMELQVRVEKD